ncbi:MAG: LemA family protein [Gammaproteobacteria bacterium]|jgi:LemA protein|nr:LemA family protein [Gammaproteobacteria bacterium]MBT4380446.1 LemA family protein [Gammaproteobacteria bacterium]MBT4617531.1 LemA family protein [Gammaproteobacteria bacterium]MBT5196657.1 LemA family protein [Gammaproteobacteria bacterium]MBT5443804.1 LemA family protein [Gammaproteobacteria bacterium]
MDVSTIIILVVLAALAMWTVAIYNQLVALKNRYKNAFAQIEVQLKRRYDLIPNLVETAKGYMEHERGTLEAVTKARDAAASMLADAAKDPGNAAAIKNLATQEGVLQSALGKFSIAVEAYPDLKASENMMQLTEELTSTENKIAFSRQAFNDQIMSYNTYRQSFPQIVLAARFGHPTDAELLEFADSEAIQDAPSISF